MKIINPLYDKSFKYLMENERMAKKVISVLLDTQVDELSVGQQEVVLEDDKRKLSLFRLDFTAIIRTSDGEQQKVLIELQKSKFPTDIQRFRNYLAANYLTKSVPTLDKQNTIPYPIITVYILGYKIDDLPYLAVTVNREIMDAVKKERLYIKNSFIDKLTHKSHIIQVRRLSESRKTKLENFLVLFNQAWCTDEEYIIDLQEIPEEFAEMANYLQLPVMDEEFRRKLRAEQEIDIAFDQLEARLEAAKVEATEAKAREEEERRLKEEAKTREEEERRLKEEAKAQQHRIAVKFALQLLKAGVPLQDIASETGLSISEIEKL